jgi:hypothetical protein
MNQNKNNYKIIIDAEQSRDFGEGVANKQPYKYMVLIAVSTKLNWNGS